MRQSVEWKNHIWQTEVKDQELVRIVCPKNTKNLYNAGSIMLPYRQRISSK